MSSAKGGSLSRRVTGAAAALAVLATVVTWSPPVADAQAAQRCADMFNVTKPTPARNQLPGFGNNVPAPKNASRYDYDNPGEAARGLGLPDPEDLADYGEDSSPYKPGSKEHVYTTWNAYQKRKAKELKDWNDGGQVGKKPSEALPYQKWLNRYVPNMGNDNKGTAFEGHATRDIGLGGADWMCQDRIRDAQGRPVSGRFYDAINHREKLIYEFKAGSGVDREQVRRDQEFARRHGYRIQYVFGRNPSRAARQALVDAGLEPAETRRATGRVLKPGVPAPGPSSGLLNPTPANPGKGAATDLFDSAGRNREQARSVQDVDDDFARRSGRPDGKVDGLPRRPGGIDFSTMELRYLAEQPEGGAVEFAFEADENANEEEEPSFGGFEVAQLTSDSLFTWLALPESSFWVNLNPDQPDQILDDKLASTDAGRVLLEADLRMKHVLAKVMVPDNPIGTRFWDSLRHVNGAPCWVTYRVWAEAAPASVREDGGQLYILDAPLKVQAEPLAITVPPGRECTQPEEVQEYNFGRIKDILIPEVEKAVNTTPDFQDLRSVYHARVAAAWLRQRNEVRPNAYDPIIDSGDVTKWPARTQWSKQKVYEDYLKSFRDGDYTFTREYEQDGEVLTFTFATGGVDFGKSPRAPIPAETFTAQYPTLPDTVTDARADVVEYEDTTASWLGADNARRADPPTTRPPTTQPPTQQPTVNPPAPNQPAPNQPAPQGSASPPLAQTGAAPLGLIGVAALLLAAGTALLVWQRRRRRS
ncbi:hypothetical protein [Actinokineospora terrae]|uniref:LPXTG-motif cell wall anchor domain-containing protein n=1 Tax=Actinokineospora terrae TaxID=155974 RepID=A0A1H9WIG8_9PSEU|nr:hypothetical protein [Actinokineospora terrae]SES33253.1 hypothetical protein SAMN04487818_110201 [Actinokineospora terrae]